MSDKYIEIGNDDFIVANCLDNGLLELGVVTTAGGYVGRINKDDAIKLIKHIKFIFTLEDDDIK